MDIAALINTSFFAMTPIALAALGEVVAERSGIVNIGLEGIILISGFTAVLGAETGNSWVIGLLVGALTGALFGVIHGFIGIYAKGDQVVSGIGINLFAIGFVAYGLIVLWNTPGVHMMSMDLTVPKIGGISPIFISTIILAIILNWLFKNSVIGLRIDACGENPEAADVAGVNVELVRFAACIFGSMLAGIAGAFLSIDWFGFTTRELAAGRGFIALACVVFSGLNPLLALGGAALFGFSQGISMEIAVMPGVKDIIPFYFIHMLPYVITLIVVAIAIGRKRFPRSLGAPYKRE
ncbi:MAG: ABC transporter permease [Candidatus Thermoplasmatota archaeon]|nr:ABC transporter permease [Candidatus Thermoplasmatota archaeon]